METISLTETLRTRRGHDFYPPKADRHTIPPIYGTETQEPSGRIVHLHYFAASSDWWITELDAETGLAYGYACLNGDAQMAEWGYINLPELEALHLAPGRSRPLPIIVERDTGWTPTPLAKLTLPGSN